MQLYNDGVQYYKRFCEYGSDNLDTQITNVPCWLVIFAQDSSLPVVVQLCTADNSYIWLAVLFAYKGILLIVGVILAFQTRKIKIRHLNDSHLIAMCVYGVVILSMALVPIGLALEDNVDLYYALMGLLIMLGVSLLLSVIFLPKVR